jgi:hypothetical protein
LRVVFNLDLCSTCQILRTDNKINNSRGSSPFINSSCGVVPIWEQDNFCSVLKRQKLVYACGQGSGTAVAQPYKYKASESKPKAHRKRNVEDINFHNNVTNLIHFHFHKHFIVS